MTIVFSPIVPKQESSLTGVRFVKGNSRSFPTCNSTSERIRETNLTNVDIQTVTRPFPSYPTFNLIPDVTKLTSLTSATPATNAFRTRLLSLITSLSTRSRSTWKLTFATFVENHTLKRHTWQSICRNMLKSPRNAWLVKITTIITAAIITTTTTIKPMVRVRHHIFILFSVFFIYLPGRIHYT